MTTRAVRRHHRERIRLKWLRLRRNWHRFLGDDPDMEHWARRMVGRGSLSVQGCFCCSNLRRRYGPRFSERRQLQTVDEPAPYLLGRHVFDGSTGEVLR